MRDGGISLTFDVDGEAGLACRAVPGGWADRLSSRSEARFGLLRGLPRILAVLSEFDAPATFYVPGAVAGRERAAVAEIVAAGHEIGHHGHDHLPSHGLSAERQRAEIERGLSALAEAGGGRPAGYRSPAWELTPVTLALLVEHGFTHDSSLMGDDRPYRLEAGLLELPVHWSLDDVPFFAYGAGIPHAPPVATDLVIASWLREQDAARDERRHLTFTMHPELTGRAGRIDLLRAVLRRAAEHRTPVLPHGAVA